MSTNSAFNAWFLNCPNLRPVELRACYSSIQIFCEEKNVVGGLWWSTEKYLKATRIQIFWMMSNPTSKTWPCCCCYLVNRDFSSVRYSTTVHLYYRTRHLLHQVSRYKRPSITVIKNQQFFRFKNIYIFLYPRLINPYPFREEGVKIPWPTPHFKLYYSSV